MREEAKEGNGVRLEGPPGLLLRAGEGVIAVGTVTGSHVGVKWVGGRCSHWPSRSEAVRFKLGQQRWDWSGNGLSRT